MRTFNVYRSLNVRRPSEGAFLTVEAWDITHAVSLAFGESIVTMLTTQGPDAPSIMVYAPNGNWLGDVA